MVKSWEKWGKVEKVGKSGGEKLKKWQKVVKSGEKLEKWEKVVKREKVVKSGKKWGKVG